MDQKVVTNVTIVLCVLCLALGAYNLYATMDGNDKGMEDKVVMSFGIDSGKPENMALLENAVLDEITSRGYGFTMYWAEGGYASDTGTIFGQDTLVVMITFIDVEAGKQLVNAVKKEVGDRIGLDAVLIESFKLNAELITF